jgi:hypothetical protein
VARGRASKVAGRPLDLPVAPRGGRVLPVVTGAVEGEVVVGGTTPAAACAAAVAAVVVAPSVSNSP